MKILILSPHTDDAELGAGGTISRFIREGNHEIYWIVFSTCEGSLPKDLSSDTLKKEFLSVVNSLGIKRYKILNYKVRYLFQHRQEVLEYLIKIRNEFKPDLVIGPSTKDYHQDHQVVSNEMIRAFKSTSSIIGYELPWNHLEFSTNIFFNLTEEDIISKIKILNNYKSQLVKERVYFEPELIKGLSLVRGTQSNSKYAEAFEVIKWIN